MTLLKKFQLHFIKRISPAEYARKIGVSVGVGTRFTGTPNFGSEPWLISIGKDTLLSSGIMFITHDGGINCFRRQERYKNVVKFGRIKIGDNCFIGARSTIMPGVAIGDNSIVAAGAVVCKDIPAGEVWGGYRRAS